MQFISSVLLACLATLLFPRSGLAQGTEAPSGLSSTPLRVLFIGNSYTSSNGMPSMLAAMGAAAGQQPIDVKVRTEPSATLAELGGFRLTEDLISEGNWDFVVLQEQSMQPLRNPEKMHRAVREIDAQVKKANANATTVLFLTWTRRSQQSNQQAFDLAYNAIGKEIKARVAPVGPAWRAALATAPTIPLYTDDGSHPTATGSYLAACVIYLTVVPTKTSCPALDLNGVSAEHAEIARKSATAVLAERR